ncbi:MAG: hypothetical protein ACI3XM_04690 [Eubacteriales bacterium]
MRSIIIAAVLFVILISGAAITGFVICGKMDMLTSLTEQIPADTNQIEETLPVCRDIVGKLYDAWDGLFPFLTYVTGYTALNRADDAVMELYCAIGTEAFEDAVTARAKLLDALRRMREMETISPGSVF